MHSSLATKMNLQWDGYTPDGSLQQVLNPYAQKREAFLMEQQVAWWNQHVWNMRERERKRMAMLTPAIMREELADLGLRIEAAKARHEL